MHIKKVIFAFSLITFGAVSQAQVINNNNPLKYRHFKTDYTTMLELANKERLPLMNPLMILVKIIKLRWIHILSYDQMV
ncbi:hypothetical protein AB7X73_14420, partial [Providencia rettgeri]